MKIRHQQNFICLACLAMMIFAILTEVKQIRSSHDNSDTSSTTSSKTSESVADKTESDDAATDFTGETQTADVLYDGTEVDNEFELYTNYSYLFVINESVGYYTYHKGSDASFDYTDGQISGYYTGVISDEYDGYAEIDYKDGTVLVPMDGLTVASDTTVISCGVFSQVLENYTGYAGCGPACLYSMMLNYQGSEDSGVYYEKYEYAQMMGEPFDIYSYSDLLTYAENNGYGDQGTLLHIGGGMTSTSIVSLAKDIYGVDLVNHYDAAKSSAETVKEIIDSGSQAIVLVSMQNQKVVTTKSSSHFILATGYTYINGELNIIYSNSYYESNVTHGNSLDLISADDFDTTASIYFGEPNCILSFDF